MYSYSYLYTQGGCVLLPPFPPSQRSMQSQSHFMQPPPPPGYYPPPSGHTLLEANGHAPHLDDLVGYQAAQPLREQIHRTPYVGPALDALDNGECAICCEAYTQPVSLQPCHHCFCNRCIRLCVSCPLCRGNIASRIPVGRVISAPPPGPEEEDNEELGPWFTYNLTKNEFDAVCAEFAVQDVNSCGYIGKSAVASLVQKVSESTAPMCAEDLALLFGMQQHEGGVRLTTLITWLSFNRPAMLDIRHRRELRDLRRKRDAQRASGASHPTPPPIQLDPEITSAPSVADLLNQYRLPSDLGLPSISGQAGYY